MLAEIASPGAVIFFDVLGSVELSRPDHADRQEHTSQPKGNAHNLSADEGQSSRKQQIVERTGKHEVANGHIRRADKRDGIDLDDRQSKAKHQPEQGLPFAARAICEHAQSADEQSQGQPLKSRQLRAHQA